MTATSGASGTPYGYTGEYTSNDLVYLRARHYDPAMGRFLTRDTWMGNYNKPLSLNRWAYGYGNPVKYTDLTGHTPECGPFATADLTQWLIDELNADKDSWIISLVKTYIDMSPVSQGVPPYPPSQDSGSFDPALYGYLLFADAVKSGGLWDFKLKINEYIGNNIRINDTWYYYDVSGNITFGYLGLAAGISEDELHCGADAANDKSIFGYCSGNDPAEDYDAIEAGFDLWKLTKGRMITPSDLLLALQTHSMSKGKPTLPKNESIFYWPYKVGTFDGTGSVFARR